MERLARPAVAAPGRTPAPPLPASGTNALLVGVVVVAALYLGREIFIPLVLAVLLAFVLTPIVNLLRHLRLGRVGSVIATVVVTLGILLGIGAIIGQQVSSLATDLPRYQSTIRTKVDSIKDGALGRATGWVQQLSHQIQQSTDAPPTTTPSQPQSDGKEPMLVRVQEPDPSPLTLAQNILGPVLAPLTTLGIVLVVVVFILLQREDLRDRMIRLFGAQDLHRTTLAMDDAAGRLSTYFLTQLGINAAFGVLISIGLWLIGVPSPILWGVFAGLMRFVPYIGAFISAAAPIALAAAVDSGWSMALWTVALFLVTEPIMGHVIEPLLYGHSTGLSPFAVVFSALFWTFLWGPIGLVLATPFTVCLVVLGRHVERLEFFDVLLGDRPALTPVENFYQRMLAGDPDEAQEQAEILLRERSISSYYDEVALKALQLAANDYQRGVLNDGQLETIRALTQSLVEEFAERPDEAPKKSKTPEPDSDLSLAEKEHPKNESVPDDAPARAELPPMWRGDAPVLCIAGRGPLDEAAASMLAQLLGKHRLGARLVPHLSVSRAGVRDLDVSGVAMICISYLDISGNPAHLRYLLTRLKRKAPDAQILVGLWPADDAILTNQALRTEVGADHYVVSLRQAVERCVQAAKEAAPEEERTFA